MYTQDISKLFSLPANSELRGFLGFTYSFDGDYFVKAILSNLGLSKRQDVRKLDYFRVVAHYSSILSTHRLIYDRVTPYKHVRGSHVSFHPKLYIIKYRQGKTFRTRIILGSFNLSKTGLNNTHEYSMSLDVGKERKVNASSDISRLIKQIAHITNKKIDVGNIPQNREIEYVCQCGREMFGKIFENIEHAKAIHVVSPFWNGSCVKKLYQEAQKKKVALHFYCNTDQDAAAILKWIGKDKCKVYINQHFVDIKDSNQGEDYETQVSSQDNVMGGAIRAFNHAKLVLIQYAGAKPLLFIGSANFTSKGLGIGKTMNIECGALVRSNKIHGIEQFITIKGKPTKGAPYYMPADIESLEQVNIGTAGQQSYVIDDIVDSIFIGKPVISKGEIKIRINIDHKAIKSLVKKNHIQNILINLDGQDVSQQSNLLIKRKLSAGQKGLKLVVTISGEHYERELPLILDDEMVRQIDLAADNAMVETPDDLFDINYLEKWDDVDSIEKQLDEHKNVASLGLLIKRFPFQSLMRVLFSKDNEALGIFGGRLANYLGNEQGENAFLKHYEMSKGNYLTLLRYIKMNISRNKKFIRDKEFKHDRRLLISTINKILAKQRNT